MQEVSMTLHGLGMKKSQANSVVSKLCKELKIEKNSMKLVQ